MKAIVWTLGILFLGSCSAGDQSVRVSPEDEDFQIVFPAAPQDETETEASGFGEVKMRRFTLAPEGGSITHQLTYHEYPPTIFMLGERWQLLDARRAQVKADLKGKIRDTHEVIELGDEQPGQKFVVETDDDQVVYVRIYFIDDRIYELKVTTPAGQEDPAAAEAFFDSFGLVY